MQQHTAQHLLTAIALERHGWRTTAFHLGESVSDIELDVPALSRLQIDALEDEVAAEVRAARPVRARRVTEAEYGTLPVRSRGLPEGFAGDIRLVEIEGLDLNTCGGTHVRSTAELEAVALLGTEPMRGGTRLHFVAGGRLRRRLAGHEARNAAIKAVLDAPESEFAALVQRRKDELRDAERRLRALAEELAAAQAEALAGRPDALVDAHFDGRDPAFLGTLARRLATLAPAKLAFLTATNEAGSYLRPHRRRAGDGRRPGARPPGGGVARRPRRRFLPSLPGQGRHAGGPRRRPRYPARREPTVDSGQLTVSPTQPPHTPTSSSTLDRVGGRRRVGGGRTVWDGRGRSCELSAVGSRL